MSVISPVTPFWPDKGSARLPRVEPLPLVDPESSWLRRVWTWATKNPEYLIIYDYFTHVPYQEGFWAFVPENFVLDFASVPRPLTSLFAPTGIWAYPAVPHDFGYRFGGLIISLAPNQPYSFVDFTRKEIDAIFNLMADKANRLNVLNTVGSATLRVTGSIAYKPRSIVGVDWSQPVRKS